MFSSVAAPVVGEELITGVNNPLGPKDVRRFTQIMTNQRPPTKHHKSQSLAQSSVASFLGLGFKGDDDPSLSLIKCPRIFFSP